MKERKIDQGAGIGQRKHYSNCGYNFHHFLLFALSGAWLGAGRGLDYCGMPGGGYGADMRAYHALPCWPASTGIVLVVD